MIGWRRRGTRPARSGVEELRVYTINSLYIVYALIPLLALVWIRGAPQPAAVAFMVVAMLQCASSVLVLRAEAAHELDGAALPRWALPLLGGTTGLGCVLAFALPPTDGTPLSPPVGPLWLFLMAAATAIAPRLSSRAAIGVSVALSFVAAGAGALVMLASGSGWDLGGVAVMFAITLATCLVMTLVMVLLTRWTVAILVSIHDEAQMDAMRADLAVADERLRIARDLHDVFGRTLTAVSVKSQLAAELCDAGRTEDSARESRAVTGLAEDALREIRGVLAGYRAPDLATELAGARSLLNAAGIHTRLIGSPGDVPTDAAQALAVVLHEAATNVVRHSDASECTMAVRMTGSDDRTAVLVLVNDGVRRPTTEELTDAPGSGLPALADRISALGGTLEYGPGDRTGTFAVTATVPTDDATTHPHFAREANLA